MYLLVLRPLVKVSLVSIILATMALSILFENFALHPLGRLRQERAGVQR